MQTSNSILPVNSQLPDLAFDVHPYVKATQRVSLTELDTLQLCRERISKKSRAIFEKFVRLYQAESPADFTRERLLELRGCGEGTAHEILTALGPQTQRTAIPH